LILHSKKAAAIDGATEWQIFRKIILPTMKPVNIIIVVITLIESLRAFDLVYIIYGSPTIFPLLNLLVFQNFAGQGLSMKGAAYAVNPAGALHRSNYHLPPYCLLRRTSSEH